MLLRLIYFINYSTKIKLQGFLLNKVAFGHLANKMTYKQDTKLAKQLSQGEGIASKSAIRRMFQFCET